jgi:hypothetical protein
VIPSGIASTTTGPTLTRPPGFGSTDRLEHIAWRRHAVQHPAALAAGPTPITGRPSIILSSSELIAGAMGRSDTARTYTSDEYLTFGVAQQLSGASELLRRQKIRDLGGRCRKVHLARERLGSRLRHAVNRCDACEVKRTTISARGGPGAASARIGPSTHELGHEPDREK